MHLDFHKAIKGFRWHICFKKDRFLNESNFKISHPAVSSGMGSKLHNHCSSERWWELLPAEAPVQISGHLSQVLQRDSPSSSASPTAGSQANSSVPSHVPEKGNTKKEKSEFCENHAFVPKFPSLSYKGTMRLGSKSIGPKIKFGGSHFITGRSLRRELVQALYFYIQGHWNVGHLHCVLICEVEQVAETPWPQFSHL